MCIGNMTKTLATAQQRGIFSGLAGRQRSASSDPRMKQTYNGSMLASEQAAAGQDTRRGGATDQTKRKSVMY
jgi:hypothetical protein